MNFGRMPLYFIPNKGQIEGAAVFYVQGKDKTLYFSDEGVTLVLSEKIEQDVKQEKTNPKNPGFKDLATENMDKRPGRTWTVKLDFVGAN